MRRPACLTRSLPGPPGCGVERAEQLGLLQELGVDRAQGLLFCRPLDAASLTSWLDQAAPGRVSGGGSTCPSAEDPGAEMRSMRDGGASDHTIAAALNAAGGRGPSGRRGSAKSVTVALTAASA